MKRRDFIWAAFCLPTFVKFASADLPKLTVFKSANCGCCTAWIEHIEKAGFFVEAKNITQRRLSDLKQRTGISLELEACHTGFINSYFIEGHVPAEDIKSLLFQRPDALGLTVPGMPRGSPGMEMGDKKDPFDTLLVKRDGSSEVFRSHSDIAA
ncbi:MAG: DUF411 domain-containing protein [Alphaproteobacteria bacterium]|nr:DUF411 domain-containing protein [Alphaproteobacteria bacterium]